MRHAHFATRYVAVLLFALGAYGQTFEVTSVKPYVSRGPGFQGVQPACYSAGAGLNRDFADPDWFAAVEQQMGLSLQEARGPVSRFVVDSIEKPDAN